MFGTKQSGKSGALTSRNWCYRLKVLDTVKMKYIIIVTLLTSSTGVVLRAEIQCVVKMKASLSGMPE